MTTTSRMALLFSLAGAVLMARGFALEGQMLWLISNPLWVVYAHSIKAWDMVYLSTAYLMLALYGVCYLW